MLDLIQVKDRNVEDLSGGELQRFACAMVCIQAADIFMFDEPSSYLDVKQRLNAALAIRNLIHPDKFIIVVEHDLSFCPRLSLRLRLLPLRSPWSLWCSHYAFLCSRGYQYLP